MYTEPTSYKTIDELIAVHERNTPGGLTEEKKNILRAMFKREMLDPNNGVADYVYGQDEGEQNKGDIEPEL